MTDDYDNVTKSKKKNLLYYASMELRTSNFLLLENVIYLDQKICQIHHKLLLFSYDSFIDGGYLVSFP